MKRLVMKRLVMMALALLLSVAWAQPNIVVSIHPYFDIVRQIAGEQATVVRILPVGASPHTFDPTPRDLRRIAEADLVVVNGGYGIDGWLLRLIDATGVQAPIVNIFDALDFANTRSQFYAFDEAQLDRPVDPYAAVNSHLWLDPVLMQEIVPILVEGVAAVDPENAELYRANGAALIADLAALHTALSEMLAPIAGAAFVPFHDAWPYFAERYGLDLIVEIEPFPGREPTPAYLQYALGLIEGSDARAIFSEPQLSRRPAEVVAENANLPLFMIDPLGGTPETNRYQDLMRHNARVLLEALGDEPR
jgi:ABC-type Zn uptake system ZnuABC Zn-binding protein ZnuA